MEVNRFLVIIFITSVFCDKVFEGIVSENISSRSEMVAKFIGQIYRYESDKYSSKVHDLALIQLDGVVKSEIFGEIASETANENALIMPDRDKHVDEQRIRAASLTVIVSDGSDSVSLFFRFKINENVRLCLNFLI